MKILEKIALGIVRESQKFSRHAYGVHCTDIFAIDSFLVSVWFNHGYNYGKTVWSTMVDHG